MKAGSSIAFFGLFELESVISGNNVDQLLCLSGVRLTLRFKNLIEHSRTNKLQTFLRGHSRLHFVRTPEGCLHVHRGIGLESGVERIKLTLGPKFEELALLQVVSGHHPVENLRECYIGARIARSLSLGMTGKKEQKRKAP